jgi:hypothetical protein
MWTVQSDHHPTMLSRFQFSLLINYILPRSVSLSFILSFSLVCNFLLPFPYLYPYILLLCFVLQLPDFLCFFLFCGILSQGRLMRSPCYLYLSQKLIGGGGLSTFECLNQSLWNLICIYIMAPEPYRPVLSSERALQNNKHADVWKEFQGERKIGQRSQMGAWHQDRLADWLSVIN